MDIFSFPGSSKSDCIELNVSYFAKTDSESNKFLLLLLLLIFPSSSEVFTLFLIIIGSYPLLFLFNIILVFAGCVP